MSFIITQRPIFVSFNDNARTGIFREMGNQYFLFASLKAALEHKFIKTADLNNNKNSILVFLPDYRKNE